MKIAVPSEGNKISPHFGRCSQFTIIDVNDGGIINKEVIPNPGHTPGFLPKFLNEQGVDVVLVSGMGRRAKDLFDQMGIKVISGASGSVGECIESYLAGKLDSTDDFCEHDHNH
ncbi:NifB/NifX family molybdenum-iron cluster-binding protein [Halothermothrix orenii]|uniref:Dinitrogenase iron-molybdenum cofactor biosynthesis protein n=1 Tax=Halothermothrix orenii (strain H 168 / OCM 544 / DSM 9562) TaxID=373903 RepID=B8CZ66_HALOH|nr:NifB/NifX family molybdenum-iron cluster-binding protein [Halothermothrix orenii]ACL70585.1 Dinitrogenase iron-molybdenum cofactor biosynthesis protein [Halothermothrix orenii H 168]